MARTKQTIRTRSKATAGTKPRNQYVDVPLYQALITSMFLTLLVTTLALSFNWPYQVPLLTLGFSLFIAWLWRLGLWDRLLFVAEVITSQDLNGDNQIGHLTVVQGAKARATSAKNAQQSQQDTRLKDLETFVRKCYSVGTSESAQGVKPSDRSAYLEMRDALFRLGLAGWKTSNPRSGWKLLVSEDAAYATIQNHVVNSS